MVEQRKIKSSESELSRKRKYYLDNKEKILKRKKERSMEIYLNKRMNLASNEDEFEKEHLRAMSRMEAEKPESCELCSAKESDLGHFLERHHMDYENTQVVWVCKSCHAELDRWRRRE
jgi:superfamily II helicase